MSRNYTKGLPKESQMESEQITEKVQKKPRGSPKDSVGKSGSFLEGVPKKPRENPDEFQREYGRI